VVHQNNFVIDPQRDAALVAPALSYLWRRIRDARQVPPVRLVSHKLKMAIRRLRTNVAPNNRQKGMKFEDRLPTGSEVKSENQSFL
jgi:hypothetical protein